MELISPAGFEEYFHEIAPLLAAGNPNDPAIAQIRQRYGLDLDAASVPLLVERPNLRPG